MKALAIFSRQPQPVTYEVRLEIDPAVVAEFDDWLRDHAREMLAFPGFQSASVYRGIELSDAYRAVRVVTYDVRSRRELDSYLHTHAPRMRKEGANRFGKQFTATRRILPTAEYALPEGLAVLYDRHALSGGFPVCGNCHQPVPGRFCANCGQEDRTFMLSLGELTYDFFGDIFNYDSRFFRTLRPLLFRPGLLTADYVRGRRQHYLPPVRMYIFISLIFFFFAAAVTDFDFGDDIEAELDETPVVVTGTRDMTSAERAEVERAMKETAAALGLPDDAVRFPDGVEETSVEDAEPEASEPSKEDDPDNDSGPSIRFGDGKAQVVGFGDGDFEERIERGADALRKNPKAFAQAVMQQIPTMMFFFLPLIAVVLKLLYIGTGRYYVEHLIFALHFHSAVFVLLMLWLAFGELQERVEILQPFQTWITGAVWIYIPFYLYRSLRCVYGQGRFFTIIKYLLLFFAYFMALTATFTITLLFTLYMQA